MQFTREVELSARFFLELQFYVELRVANNNTNYLS